MSPMTRGNKQHLGSCLPTQLPHMGGSHCHWRMAHSSTPSPLQPGGQIAPSSARDGPWRCLLALGLPGTGWGVGLQVSSPPDPTQNPGGNLEGLMFQQNVEVVLALGSRPTTTFRLGDLR